MDYYDRYEDSLNEQHDYNVCMATCPDYKTASECGCRGGGDETLGWLSLGLTILLIVVVCVVINLVATHKENKELKEWREKQDRERKERKK